MPPPFNINESSPAPSALISAFPADEQSNRAEIEEWLAFISDPATGLIRPSVLPPASNPIPSGTKMVFVQTAAPTGFTKDITHNNKALRVVNGTASSGGTVTFTDAFASKAVAGTIGNTTATGTISNTTSTGTVGGHTLTTAEMPSHSHGSGTLTNSNTNSTTGISSTFSVATGAGPSAVNGINNPPHTHDITGNTAATGSGNSHSHPLTMNAHGHTFTGAAHNHTFTGTAIDLAVQYVDVIIATKD